MFSELMADQIFVRNFLNIPVRFQHESDTTGRRKYWNCLASGEFQARCAHSFAFLN